MGLKRFFNGLYHFFTDSWSQRMAWLRSKLGVDIPASSVDTSIESRPDLSGASNVSGADKPIPLILGKHKLTPYYCGRPYRTISGDYGEKQTYHALYNLGYKNTVVSDIKLGQIDLASGTEEISEVVYDSFTESSSGEDSFVDSNGIYYDCTGLEKPSWVTRSYTSHSISYSQTKPSIKDGLIIKGKMIVSNIAVDDKSTYSGVGYETINIDNPLIMYIPVTQKYGTIYVKGHFVTSKSSSLDVYCSERNVISKSIKYYYTTGSENKYKYYSDKGYYTVAGVNVLENLSCELDSEYNYNITVNFSKPILKTVNVISSYYVPICFFNLKTSFQLESIKVVNTEVKHGELYVDGRWSASAYNIHLELQEGANSDRDDGECAYYPQKVVEESIGVELTHINDSNDTTGAGIMLCERVSAKNPMKCQIHFTLNGLFLVNDDGKKKNASVSVCIQYSTDGGKTFSNFGCPNSSVPEKWSITENQSCTVQGQTFTGLDVYTITDQYQKDMRFYAERTFTYEEAMNAKNRYIEFRIFRYNAEGSKDNYTFYDTIALTNILTWCYDYGKSRGAYTDDSSVTYNNNNEHYEYWDSTNEKWSGGTLIAQAPMIKTKRDLTTRLAFQVDASTTEFKNQLEELNCIITSKGRTCTKGSDGIYTWSDDYTATQNPASLALMLLQHESRGKHAYTDDKIDLQSLGALYEFCNTPRKEFGKTYAKFQCNGVLTSQSKTSQVLHDILSTCRAFYSVSGGKYYFSFDKPDENKTLVLNNSNTLSFSVSKSFPENFDGVKVKFIDENNDYESDEIKVLYDDSKSGEANLSYKQLEMKWQTDASQVFQQGKYYLATYKLHPEVWQVKTSVDAHLLSLCSRIGVQGDTICVGIGDGGEITELLYDEDGDLIGVITDCKINMASYEIESGYYELTITMTSNYYDPKVITVPVIPIIDSYGYVYRFDFEETFDFSDGIRPMTGDIVSFGFSGKSVVDAIVFGKKDNGDGTFDLTLTPYQSGIYEKDSDTIPDFDSKVTRRSSGNDYTAETATALDVANVETSVSEIAQKVTSSIRVLSALSESGADGEVAVYNGCFFQYSADSGSWVKIEDSTYLGCYPRAGVEYPETASIGSFFLCTSSVQIKDLLVLSTDSPLELSNGTYLELNDLEANAGYIYVCNIEGWKRVEDRNDWRYIVAFNDLYDYGFDLPTNEKKYIAETALTIAEAAVESGTAEYTPKYLGSTSIIPTSPHEGDYFCYSGTTTSIYEKGRVYKYSSESGWVKLDENDTANSRMFLDAVQDIVSLMGGTAGYFSTVFANCLIATKLFATEAEIGKIQTGEIVVGQASSATNATNATNVSDGSLSTMTTDATKSSEIAIHSSDWTDSSSTSGFGIMKNGDAYFNNGTFRGTLCLKVYTKIPDDLADGTIFLYNKD